MKYAIVFLLAFTLLFTLFFMLLTRAALAEMKYLWLERKSLRYRRHGSAMDDDFI